MTEQQEQPRSREAVTEAGPEPGSATHVARRRLLGWGTAAGAGVLLAAGGSTRASAVPNNETGSDTDVMIRRTVTVRAPDGIRLVGTLRIPRHAPRPAPAVLLSPPGPVAVADQSVVAGYADRLTAAGYVTLALDPRNLGRSEGRPRQHFDVIDRLRDGQAAVSYLSELRHVVDPTRIGTFGVSAGGTMSLVLAGYDPRVAAFVGVCGGYTNPLFLRGMLGGAYDEQLRQAVADLQRYHVTGNATYMPVVTPDGRGAFLSGVEPYPTEGWDYYGTERGESRWFVNRVTTMSVHTVLTFDSLSPAEFMGDRAGLLIAGGEDVYVPAEGTREAHRRLTGPRQLIVVDGARHTDFYDREPYVSTVTDAALAWFTEHL